MGFVVAFISQKGGVGKSTLTRALAREAANSGLNVKVADLDHQQATVTHWNLIRMQNDIQPVLSVEPVKKASIALTWKEQHDLVIIDGPARTSTATLEMAQVADLIVQPSGTSLDDLRPAVLVFHELVREKIPTSKLVVALCRSGTDTEEAEARAYIEEAGYTVLAGCLPERPAYRLAMNAGLAVTETRYPQLSQRADAVMQAIIDRI